MPTFRYEAVKGNERIKGEIEAPNKAQAINMLKGRGLVVVRISSSRSFFATSKMKLSMSLSSRKIILKDRELALLSRQLGNLLLAGISLVDGLSTLQRNIKIQGLARYWQHCTISLSIKI